ncbi:hypothetical protein ACMATS_38190 (plasmid) [Streptoverticillium reticulum]|uniref:hypothetical protein n=1 Tax=Streptoverticillium reticulum TaxID=1433415 RepID=UPI0039BF968E
MRASSADQRTEHHLPHAVARRARGACGSRFYKVTPPPAGAAEYEVRRAALAERITRFFNAWGRTYDSPRITLDPWAED